MKVHLTCFKLLQMNLLVSRTLVSRSLFNLRLQLQIVARDQGKPQRQDEMFLEVSVVRDQGLLRFSSEVYQVRLSENKDVNTEAARVNAAPSVSG